MQISEKLFCIKTSISLVKTKFNTTLIVSSFVLISCFGFSQNADTSSYKKSQYDNVSVSKNF